MKEFSISKDICFCNNVPIKPWPLAQILKTWQLYAVYEGPTEDSQQYVFSVPNTASPENRVQLFFDVDTKKLVKFEIDANQFNIPRFESCNIVTIIFFLLQYLLHKEITQNHS